MDEIERLGRVIDRRREAAGFSLDALAARAHIPRQSLRRYLATGELKTSHLIRISLALGTTPTALWAEVVEVSA